MTDEEAIQIYNEMKACYGEKLPCPEQQPIEFKYYYQLFKYYRNIPNDNN